MILMGDRNYCYIGKGCSLKKKSFIFSFYIFFTKVEGKKKL